MPKCLDCDNTGSFAIREIVVKTAYYDESGVIYDSKHEEVEASIGLACNNCESKNVVGSF